MLESGATAFFIDRDRAALDRICPGLGDRAVPWWSTCWTRAASRPCCRGYIQHSGHLDIFHANAGSYVGGELVEGDPGVWDRLLNLNINAAFRSVHAVLAHRVVGKTGDVILTRIAGVVPVIWEPIYTASKHAIQAFVHTVRRQVAKHGYGLTGQRR